MDFLDYAYLPSGQESKTRQLVGEVKSVPGAKAEDTAEKGAFAKLRSAADHEDSENNGPFATAAEEMLADMLLDLNRSADALTEYEEVLTKYPNRFDALYGAARASEALGKSQSARKYYGQLILVTAPTADRLELREAREHATATATSLAWRDPQP